VTWQAAAPPERGAVRVAGSSLAGIIGGFFSSVRDRHVAAVDQKLAWMIILAAGVLKVPDLTGPLGNGIRGQILAGSVLSGIGAYLSVRFLVRYFQTRTLTPFAIYCVVFGLASVIYRSVK
jgi:undecaprenyl-diphosphatase